MTSEISATDELRKKWNDAKPSKSEMEKAQYEIAHYRPTYPDSTGWPAMRKLKMIFILGTFYLGFWVWHGLRVRDFVLPANAYVDGLGFMAVIGLSGLALGMLWKLNEGCFSDFRIILEPFLVVYKGELHRSMLRIRKIKQIYPLDPDIMVTADELAGDLTVPRDPIIWSTSTDPVLEYEPLKEEPKEEKIPDPPKLKDPDSPPKQKKTPKGDSLRPSSITEMIELIEDILDEEPVAFRDNVDMAVELESRFVALVKDLNLEKFVNMAETPDYPCMFITDYPVESPTGKAKQIQFGIHDFYQKTYVWDKKNSSSSSWGVTVHLDDFRYWVWNSAKKKWILRFAPIFYVAFSDGNLDGILTQLWPKDRDKRKIEESRYMAQQAKDAYTATLAEELIIRDKMTTGIIDQKDKEINLLERKGTKGAKKIVAQGLRWAVLAGEAMDDSNMDRLRALFSKGAIKWIVYLVIAIMAFIGLLIILQLVTGVQFLPLPDSGGGGGSPDDGADTYIPGAIILSLIGWLL